LRQARPSSDIAASIRVIGGGTWRGSVSRAAKQPDDFVYETAEAIGLLGRFGGGHFGAEISADVLYALQNVGQDIDAARAGCPGGVFCRCCDSGRPRSR